MNVDPTDGDGEMSDSSFMVATLVLVLPFVLIPTSIIATRLAKYLWKVYQAKKYGYGCGDILDDPLEELGLKIRRGYENTAEIRKIRKEKRKQAKQTMKRRESDARRAKLNEQILHSRPGEPESRNGFQIPDFVPFHAAEQYLEQLRKQTAKTWYEKLSPDAVRRWFNVSLYARLWMIMQVTCTALSIANYVALTYLASRADRDERNTIKHLDLFYACVFLADYLLSFYIAEDRLLFYLNPMSLIDLMSIVTPFVYLFVASPTKYVWFIGFVRIFRATRILRTYRLLSFTQSEQARELTLFVLNFVNFVFFSASIINATEALDFANTPPSLKNWHDSLYYIMVTFSTIGFGDLTPTSTISRMVVICLILMVLLYVPYQTGKILEIFNSMSKYQRAQHTASLEVPHIVIGGTITYSSVIDFCREFFVADEVTSVIILHDEEPTLEIRRLLNHPFYRSRLTYLRGNLMSMSDLKRAQLQYATGFFLLNSDSVQTDNNMNDSDTSTLMSAIYAKSAFPGIPIFAQINDGRTIDFAKHCGIDRILCIDEIKSSLFASNCLCPGLQTLILNLIHSYKYVEPDSHKEFWTQEYQCGVANQVQSFKIPSGLVGLKFGDVVREIYQLYNTMLIALISTNAGFNQNSIRFCIDMDYRLKADDIAFCIGDGGDENSLRIAMHFKEAGVRENFEQKELEIELEHIGSSKSESSSPFLSTPGSRDFKNQSSSLYEEVSLGSIPNGLTGHIIVSGFLPTRTLMNFIQTIRNGASNAPEIQEIMISHRDTPIVCILDTLPDVEEFGSIWKEILSYHSIYVIVGRPVEKKSLIQASIDKCARVVVFAKQEGQHSSTTSTSDSQSVFLVKLLQKEWPNVKFLVEMIDGSNVKYFSSREIEWNTENLRVQSILNNYGLGISDRLTLYRGLRTEGLRKNMIIYQLIRFITGEDGTAAAAEKVKSVRSPVQEREIKKSNKSGDYESIEPLQEKDEDEPEPVSQANGVPLTEVFLNKALEQAELNDSGLSPYPVYHFDKHFAAGMIASASFMQSLLCQSYFRPYIVDIVKGLISNICALPVKDSLAGKRYIEVVDQCIQQGYIPLGLYRNGGNKSTNSESLPYVYTNCRQGDIVNQTDLIFAIRKYYSTK